QRFDRRVRRAGRLACAHHVPRCRRTAERQQRRDEDESVETPVRAHGGCCRYGHAAASEKLVLSRICRSDSTGHCSAPRLNAPARYRSQRATVGGASPVNSPSAKRRKPSTSSTTSPAGISRWFTTTMRVLRVIG